MRPRTMNYCPFCGSEEIQYEPAPTRGPEEYYDCPGCGTVGTTGVGYTPFRQEQSPDN